MHVNTRTVVLISGDRFLRAMFATSEGPEYEQEGKLAKKHTSLPKDGGAMGLSQSVPNTVCLTHLWYATWWDRLSDYLQAPDSP